MSTGVAAAHRHLAGAVAYWSGDYVDDPSTIARSTPPRTIAPRDLAVGDCFDLIGPDPDEISGVVPRSCLALHGYEMFWSGAMEDGRYPDETAFAVFYGDHCLGAFEAYVGEPWGDSKPDIYWMMPTEEGWALGNRTIQCSAYHPGVPRLTYSLKGWSQSEGDPPLPL